MLIRKYIVKLDTGNLEKPFVICNVATPDQFLDLLDPDIAMPGHAELAAPGLRVVPARWAGDSGEEVQAEFRASLSSGYFDSPLPREIVDAFGETPGRTDWKVVRCTPENGSIFFVVANPKILRGWLDKDEGRSSSAFTRDSLEDELASGYVWVYLEDSRKYNLEISITNPDLTCSRYVIRSHFSAYDFVEYNNGRLVRESVVQEKNGISEIEVTEYLL